MPLLNDSQLFQKRTTQPLTQLTLSLSLFCSITFTNSCKKASPEETTIVVINNSESRVPPAPVTPAPASKEPGIVAPKIEIKVPETRTQEIIIAGNIVTTQVIAGQTVIPLEGTYSETSFRDITSYAASQNLSPSETSLLKVADMRSNLKLIQSKVHLYQIRIYEDVGYFTGYLLPGEFSQLAEVQGLSRQIIMTPVASQVVDPLEAAPLPLQLANSADGRDQFNGYSGLESIGLKEFQKELDRDIGEIADGSFVKVGVTDTGLTYNHPAFLDAKGQVRISYLSDSTEEGRMYLVADAQFSARPPQESEVPTGMSADEMVIVNATYLATPNGRTLPTADQFSKVTGQTFLVSKDLRAKLIRNDLKIQLNAIQESAFELQTTKARQDINHNQKTDDSLWTFVITDPSSGVTEVYVDFSGRGDFRQVKPLHDFNLNRETTAVFSERIGVGFGQATLSNAAGTDVQAKTVFLLGIDPGDHGSHVSGIIGARKTIQNDSDNTLARGVAPNVNIMFNRVCAVNGGCTATAGMIDLASKGAEIINMSLGGLNPWNDDYTVQEIIINRLASLYNTVFVISAGNSGPGHQTVGTPSLAADALCVGATASRKMIQRQYQYPGLTRSISGKAADDDFMLFFSSRGPTANGGFKPNITAPGTQLSSIKLNAAPGSRSGLTVMWGTSMAAPTAAGSMALLIDAGKRYNLKNPKNPVPLDQASLRRAVMAGARSFDLKSFNPQTHGATDGRYTWIDQGAGMIHLGRAWSVLKSMAQSHVDTAVHTTDTQDPVPLNYESRILKQYPNGNDYTGQMSASLPDSEGKVLKTGRGLYLDFNASDTLYTVQIARRLPYKMVKRPDIGDLTKQLVTTADTFKLETIIHGSSVPWVKAGTLNGLDCQNSVTSQLTVVGEGAVDNFNPATAGQPASVALGASNLYVCIQRDLLATLPSGDHGALIKAYRTFKNKTEVTPSFIVPVYVAIPEKSLSGSTAYEFKGKVPSFNVDRHYVQVPIGTSYVRVQIEVPKASQIGGQLSGCSGVELMILEGQNNKPPVEFDSRPKARVANCDLNQSPVDKTVLSYNRVDPKPGIWDVHVFGQYQYMESPYTLKIDFARLESEIKLIGPKPEMMTGSILVTIRDSSFTLHADESKSSLNLDRFVRQDAPKIKDMQTLVVLDAAGQEYRQYSPDDFKAITFKTSDGPAGSDIDLLVEACESPSAEKCKTIASGTGPTDVETVTFIPAADRYYRIKVDAILQSATESPFTLVEELSLKKLETGQVKITEITASGFQVDHAFNVNESKILTRIEVTSGHYQAGGELTVQSTDGYPLIRIPLKIGHKQ
jgi:subtilisin family serine protease